MKELFFNKEQAENMAKEYGTPYYVYDEKGIVALSKIPSKETLLAQLVGSLQGPMQKLAATLQALHDKKAEEEAA